jgi:threonine dehydratase
VEDEARLAACVARLNERGFFTENLTDDETTQVHLRHMVGGSANVDDERIYKVEIPERAGALDAFLAAVSPAFQITMTHYRSDGGQVGNTLFGLRVGPRRPR